jgi:hypothetical protein
MRTTLDIAEDVLLAAREIARRSGVSIGKALSDLAREGLARPGDITRRNGLPLFPVRPNAQIVTPELINQLLDEQL